MPTPTYDLIEEQVLGSAQASVTFSSIPGTYKDLVLEIQFTSNTGLMYPYLRFNSDSGTNYSRTVLSGNGTSAASSRVSNENNASITGDVAASTTAQAYTISQIMSYANSNVNTTVLSRANRADLAVEAVVNLWRSTAAITTILVGGNNSFASGSTFRLWGVSG